MVRWDHNVTVPAPLNADSIRRAPKVLLHDHLDGGLRPQTVLELADEAGYRDLPAGDAGLVGELEHRLGPQPAVQVVVQQHLRRAADRVDVQRGGHGETLSRSSA